MLAIVPILAFITVVLLVWALTSPSPQSTEARLRKHGYMPSARQMTDLDKPFSQRVVLPLMESMGGLVAKIAPQQMQARTKEKLELAKLRISPAQFLFITASLGLLLPAIILLPSLRSGHFGFRDFVFGIALFILGIRLPDFWLSRKVGSRQTKIRKSLPDALDLITICVEAGYGLDSALAKVAEKTKGPLAEELEQALMEISLGKPRGQALRDMSQRNKVPELQAFIATVVQAEQMGASIATILRIQSDGMRVKRRQLAEEEAMKAPVKMLFPLVLLILPAMFVVILGPAVLRIAVFLMGT